MELTGVNWDHRRATDPIAALTQAFHAERPDIRIRWHMRPLCAFEHEGIAGAAAVHDLVVYDHPFSGDAVASGALLDLGRALPEPLRQAAAPLYAGPSLETYRYGDGIWGGPIDGATQNGLYRADLLGDEPPPRSWQDTLALGARLKRRGQHLGMAFAGPHAILAAGSLMANAGAPWPTEPGAPFALDRAALDMALGELEALADFCPPESLSWNSIDLHEAMVARDDVAFCPCVFGYATYGEADQRRRLSFAPFAGASAPFDAGSAIGGAALGVSARTAAPDAAIAFLAFCLDEQRQAEIVTRHHGQPAVRTAWLEPATDRRFNGYFSALLPSMEKAWIRPRRRGYPAFQEAAGRIASDVVAGRTSRTDGVGRIADLATALERGQP